MMKKNNFFFKLKSGLTKTRDSLAKNLDSLLFGKKLLDPALFDELEEMLIAADMGPQFAYALIDDVKEKIKRRELGDALQIKNLLRERMATILSSAQKGLNIKKGEPYIIMVVGVNGSEKPLL